MLLSTFSASCILISIGIMYRGIHTLNIKLKHGNAYYYAVIYINNNA